MNKIIVLVIVLFCVVGISSWYFIFNEDEKKEDDRNGKEQNGQNLNETIELDFSIETYPKIDGSTSARPLQRVIACNILDVPYEWLEWGWYGEGEKYIWANNTMNENKENADFINDFNHHGTHGSYVNLINNESDIILVARMPSSDELSLAEEQGVNFEIVPVALDAFVIILNNTNQVTSLTISQIQEIYMGDITNWTEVGGSPTLINAYQRNDNSGSQELMLNLVMKDLEMIDVPELMILYGMMGPINKLSTDEDGIGYSVYFYEQFMAHNERIKLLGINGVPPTYQTIANGNYPLVTEVYAVIRTDQEKDSNAHLLLDWLQTGEGQAVIAESGYVPIL